MFGLADWMSRIEPAVLGQVNGVPANDFEDFPKVKDTSCPPKGGCCSLADQLLFRVAFNRS
jgi:hypothetical protein